MANHDESDSFNEEELKKSGMSLSEIAKKMIAVGVGAAFLTEEGIRSALGEIKLPKEILATLIQNAGKTKELIANQVTKEVVNIISKIDFVKEASRFVENHKFKITAEIDIQKKNSESPKE